MKTLWVEANERTTNSILESAQTDHKPEVLHFWMRGFSATEPGKYYFE